MSTQHDYVIADQAGAAFLADLNAALAAIVKQNEGATAPATTYACQFWADTTSGWLKQRNAANSAWIFIAPLAGHAEASLASAATTDLGAQTSDLVLVSGTTTITSFGTADAGRIVKVRHSGALTLTHNATSLILPGGANITTAANHTYEAESLGSGNWIVRAYQKADGTAVVSSGSSYIGLQMLHVRDEKSSGTTGGSASSATWHTRDLNTTVTNTITGASLASNQVTLPAGTFRVFARAPSSQADGHRIRIRNVSDATTLILGGSHRNGSGGGDIVSDATITGAVFTLATSKVVELQHYCQTAKASTGLGYAANSGDAEIYGEFIVWKE